MFVDPATAQAHPVPPEQRAVQSGQQARRPEDVVSTQDPRVTGQRQAQQAIVRAVPPVPQPVIAQRAPSVQREGEVSSRALEAQPVPPAPQQVPASFDGLSRGAIKRYARAASAAHGDVFTPERAFFAPGAFRQRR